MYVVPNVLSPRDLVSRPDNMDETVPHTRMRDLFAMVSYSSHRYIIGKREIGYFCCLIGDICFSVFMPFSETQCEF